MIHIELLKETDKGKTVFYKLFDFSDPDEGVISHWDSNYVYVRFKTTIDKKPYPVNPEDLTFEKI